jgi:hypothetical protein
MTRMSLYLIPAPWRTIMSPLETLIFSVPISKSRNIPEVVVARRGAGGVLGI